MCPLLPRLMRRILGHYGVGVESPCSIEAAIDRLEIGGLDGVVMDALVFQGESEAGTRFDRLSTALEKAPWLTITATTSGSRSGEVAVPVGVLRDTDAILRKPIEKASLIRRLRQTFPGRLAGRGNGDRHFGILPEGEELTGVRLLVACRDQSFIDLVARQLIKRAGGGGQVMKLSGDLEMVRDTVAANPFDLVFIDRHLLREREAWVMESLLELPEPPPIFLNGNYFEPEWCQRYPCDRAVLALRNPFEVEDLFDILATCRRESGTLDSKHRNLLKPPPHPMKLITDPDFPITGKRVLLRADLNVPLDKKSKTVTSTFRISAVRETIHYLLKHGASVVIISHLGRPKGWREPNLSLRRIVPELERLLERPVRFCGDCVGPQAEQAAKELKPGEVVLMENLRFHLEEEGEIREHGHVMRKASPDQIQAFRESLSRLGEVFVNDGFGVMHRAHSSVVGIYLEHRAAGLLVKREVDMFQRLLENPARPLTAIIGGAKIADKLPLIEKLIEISDRLIIAGGMAFTFLKEREGIPIGESLFDEEGAKKVKGLMAKAKSAEVDVFFPIDFVCAREMRTGVETRIVDRETGIPDGWMGLDIGPRSRERFVEVLAGEIRNGEAGTILWNGPPGVFEIPEFSEGTRAMAEAVEKATAMGVTTIVGGGDTLKAAEQFGIVDRVSHASTGGGASLEFLQQKTLPGLEPLGREA